MVLKELCALRGVSGDEKRVREYILEKVRPFATETRVDRAGNLIAFKRGAGENRRHVALVAHMDEGGMIALGAMGVLPPATSALLHNLSTLGISVRSMTDLLEQE